MWEWTELYALGFYTKNTSNLPVFDYEAAASRRAGHCKCGFSGLALPVAGKSFPFSRGAAGAVRVGTMIILTQSIPPKVFSLLQKASLLLF